MEGRLWWNTMRGDFLPRLSAQTAGNAIGSSGGSGARVEIWAAWLLLKLPPYGISVCDSSQHTAWLEAVCVPFFAERTSFSPGKWLSQCKCTEIAWCHVKRTMLYTCTVGYLGNSRCLCTDMKIFKACLHIRASICILIMQLITVHGNGQFFCNYWRIHLDVSWAIVFKHWCN